MLALLALVVPVKSVYAKGGKDGGGGNVCLGRALDLATVSAPVVGPWEREINALVAPDRMKNSLAIQALDYDAVDPIHGKLKTALDFVLSKIDHADDLRDALNGLQVFVMRHLPERRPIAADFTDAPQCAGQTHAVILYHWQMGLMIDGIEWNKLDAFNQVTLLMHEGLRNVQIRYAARFDDLTLQRLTAELMDGDVAKFNARFAKIVGHHRLPKNNGLKPFCESKINGELARKTGIVDSFLGACRAPTPRNFYRLMEDVMKKPMQVNLFELGLSDDELERFSTELVTAYRLASGVRSLRTGTPNDYVMANSLVFVESWRDAVSAASASDHFAFFRDRSDFQLERELFNDEFAVIWSRATGEKLVVPGEKSSDVARPQQIKQGVP